jgi:hypothetical protein
MTKQKIPLLVKGERVENLDDLPIIDHNYSGTTAIINTARGCNNGCEFCTSTRFYGCRRVRSLENVKLELELLKKNHPEKDTIFISDDNFLGNTPEDLERGHEIILAYKDHLKTYKKKPIYWLFDSGKANGFKCLVYMHRYEENLAAKIRIDYLHKIQRVFEKELDEVKYKLTGELSPNERKDAMNLQKDLSNKLTEIKEYNENLDHIANQKINIYLDDGVTVNYAKFESVLAKIK